MIKKWIKKLLSFAKKILEAQNIVEGKLKPGEGTSIKGSNILGELSTGENCLLFKVNVSANTVIGKNTTLWGPNINLNGDITIGSFCSIASNVSFFEKGHDYKKITTYYVFKNLFKEPKNETISKGAIKIGNDVWIGSGATILSGIDVGHGAVIAANSLVNSDVPPYAIVGGMPAKVLKRRFENDVIEKLLEVKWWDWDIDEIQKHKELFSGQLTIDNLNSII